MASSGNAGRRTRIMNPEVVKQYKILAEFDGGDGRHYIPGEVVPLEKWKQEHIQDLFERRFAVEVTQEVETPLVEQPSEAPSDEEGKEVETWQELLPKT